MSEDQQTYRRAVSAALTGMAVQIVVAVVLLVLGLWSKCPAVQIAAFQGFGGIALWITLAVVYQQHRLERLEALEAEQLAARHGTDSSIFETTAEDLSVARKRLRRLHKWSLPIVSLVTAGYLIFVGVWGLLVYKAAKATIAESVGTVTEIPDLFIVVKEPLWLLGFCVALGFMTFVVSRYMAGMAKVKQWQLLRGGAGYLMSMSLTCLALVVAFSLAAMGKTNYLSHLYVVISVFMVVVGIEIFINLILNFYRPRKLGEVPRAAFDSRLLSLLTTPESFAKTINEAINYQLGFEVTRSWFWQLLSKVFVYLVVFCIVSLLAMSCVIVIGPHEQGIVSRFGMISGGVIESGLHFKLPWPISNIKRYEVNRIRTAHAGGDQVLLPDVPILWSNLHTEGKPIHLIVASPKMLSDAASDNGNSRGGGGNTEKLPSVSLVNAEVEVEYRISDLLAYITNSSNVDKRVKDTSQLYVARYLLSNDIDALIGTARVGAGDILHDRIQVACNEAKLGVEIVKVTVSSIHPPKEVAEAFHEVVSAQQEKITMIQKARRKAIGVLAEMAGSTDKAERVLGLIEEYEKIKTTCTEQERVVAEEQLQEEVMRAGGEAARVIAMARAYRWAMENSERGNAQRFEKELLAYEKAPNLYCMRRYLEVLTEGLVDARKYVLLADRESLIIEFDLRDIETGFEGLNISSDE